MPITSTGIGSGLDIEGLVTQLVQAESQPVELRIAREESQLQAELSAYGTLKGAIAGVQNAVSGIKNISSFQKKSVDLGNSDAFTATASTNAPVGSFAIEVSQLAAAHSLASSAYTAATDVVGTGTLTIKFGTTDYNAGTDTYNGFTLNSSSQTLSITVDSTNNTLEGIRDAINDAAAGVTAVIVNDGTGYRLLINSGSTGAENSLEVTVTADGDGNDTDTGGLSALAFNASATNLSQTVAASDAQIKVNGLSVSSASNTVTDIIDGITMTLSDVTTAPVTMTVSRDVKSVTSAIETFVNGYRAFSAVVGQLSAFDKESGTGSILIGDTTLRTAASRMRQVINNPVENFSSAFSTLSEIGITTDANGSLNIDSTKLNQVVEDNFDAIAGLFSAFGQIDDKNIQFSGSGSAAKPGEYDVNISTLATQGSLTGNGVLPDFSTSSLTIDDTNDSITFKIDGVQGSAITLTQGVYTSGLSLAQELETRLNGVTEFKDAGIAVAVSYDSVNNTLTVTSDRYGSSSIVEVTSIDASTAPSIGFTVAAGAAGQDVVGTIGGLAATGDGQKLTGAAGSDAEGLVILVTGGSTGIRAPIRFSRGIGDQLDVLVTDMLATDGLLDARTSGINATLDGLKEDLADHRLRMASVEARYRAQFSALDALVAQLQSTGSFLTSALSSLPKPPSS